jgi:hypothetical protein
MPPTIDAAISSSELDRYAAVCVACGLIVWTPRARLFRPERTGDQQAGASHRKGLMMTTPSTSLPCAISSE